MTNGHLNPEHVSAAADAGLRYARVDQPGITRVRHGRGFAYRSSSGAAVTDRATLARIKALAIPPAWRDVWIAPRAESHIQATGRDARGRRQYRYHADWVAERDSSKFHRMIAFGRALPKIRARTAADLRAPAGSRARVLATLVRLLERTAIRVGNREYARANGSFGLTTMRDRHAKVRGATVRFDFRAKSGIFQHIELHDARLAAIVKQCQDLPGQTLFQYLDDEGRRHDVGSSDLNAYIRTISGADFTAKDFRTWSGTLLAAVELAGAGARDAAPAGSVARKRTLNAAIVRVAAQLGNTAAICRKCYIHPAVMDGFLQGRTIPVGHRSLRACEAALVRFLQK